MDNILDKIKQKFLQDKLASEQRKKQDTDIRPDTAPVEPDARQQAYIDANKGLSEEQKMVDEANAASKNYSEEGKLQEVANRRAEALMNKNRDEEDSLFNVKRFLKNKKDY